MTSATNDEKAVIREILSGPGLLVLSFTIIVGVASALGNSLAGGGIRLVLVAAARDVWVPNLVSLVYRRGWSRALLWPFSVAGESDCIRNLRTLSWACALIGVILVVVSFQ
jgi:hypothetical protein